MHSPHGEDVAAEPNPGLGERDLYTILAYVGIGTIGVTSGVGYLLVPEPARWWHVPFAAVLLVAALGPFLGAYGLARAARRSRRRAAARSADLFRASHLGTD